MKEMKMFDSVISTFDNNTKKVEKFLETQHDVASKFQGCTKLLYDYIKNETQRKSNALPELYVQDFDEEQIWQQVEIQNEAELPIFLTDFSGLLAGNDKYEMPVSGTKPEEKIIPDDKSSEDEDEEERIENEDEDLEFSGSDEDMDLDMDMDGNVRKKKVEPKKKTTKPSIVDDKFFKLNELDDYLNKEEKKESKDNDEDESDESDDESVDLFEGNDEFDDDDDDEEADDARMIKYAGFFDSPESAEEDETSKNKGKDSDFEVNDDEPGENNKKRKLKGSETSDKRVKFNLTNDSDDTDSIENHKIIDKDSEDAKSSLESRQERLQKRIEQLENEAISEKPWQLKGEVTGPNRPQNSLLEEYVEFDITTRPAPVITEQTTFKLEDIIKQRIKDKAWDDVVRKFKPVETPVEYKKKLVMDQEKSQKSLAQIYEDAYMKEKEALNPDDQERQEEEPKEHKEVRELMHSLFIKLDALSNFHYTPKLAQPEIKIISNIPAIEMEEVAPLATTDAQLLAPEEVKGKPRGNVIGKSERTKTDMKRARRKKKVMQREKQKDTEKKEKNLENSKMNNKKQAKNVQAAMVKKLTKDRNISTIDESTQRVPKSSTAFFSQLQDQVTSHIKAKSGKFIKKKDKNSHSAVKLKL